jgi:hypothetical protein
MITPVLVFTCSRTSLPGELDLAMPKSRIFATSEPSRVRARKMFWGLMSLCTMPRSWAA